MLLFWWVWIYWTHAVVFVLSLNILDSCCCFGESEYTGLMLLFWWVWIYWTHTVVLVSLNILDSCCCFGESEYTGLMLLFWWVWIYWTHAVVLVSLNILDSCCCFRVESEYTGLMLLFSCWADRGRISTLVKWSTSRHVINEIIGLLRELRSVSWDRLHTMYRAMDNNNQHVKVWDWKCRKIHCGKE